MIIRWDKSYSIIFILAFYFFLILLVTPSSLSSPFFIGEEAGLYFKFAYENEWYKALFSPHLGYYSMFANVTAVLAANLLPIEYAPFITVYATLGIFILIGVLVVLPNSPFQTWQQQALVLLAIIFIPPAHAKLTTLLGHFYFAVFSLLILISNTRYSKINLLNRFLLGCAGLTGSISIFFVPTFWLSYILQRDKERFIQTCILSGCALIQFIVFLFNLSVVYPEGYRVSRFSYFEMDVFVFTIFNRFIVANLTGYENMAFFGKFLEQTLAEKTVLYWLLVLLFSGILSILFFLVVKHIRKNNQLIFLFVSLCIVTILSYLSSTDGGQQPTTKIYLLYNAPRYFYIPNLIIFIGIILSIPEHKNFFYSLIILVLTIAIYERFNYFPQRYSNLTNGSNWISEVAEWRSKPDYFLRARPNEVKFQLKAR